MHTLSHFVRLILALVILVVLLSMLAPASAALLDVPLQTPTPTATNSPTGGTFCNTTTITIPDSGPGSPYPSNIAVSGLYSTLTNVNVILQRLTHTYPDDIDVLLVGPAGQNLIIMSDVGGTFGVADITLTLDDAAATLLPDAGPLTTGTFRPNNVGAGDPFPAPAPAPSAATQLNVFNGTNPNGTWSLYVVDDSPGDLGQFQTGWCLVLAATTPTPTPTATACTAPDPIANGGFESGAFAPWVIQDTSPMPTVNGANPHTGTFSAHVGSLPGGETPGDSSFYQTITVPAGGGTLSFWYWPRTSDNITFDWQDAYITNNSGVVLATIFHLASNTQTWTNQTFNMAPYAGTTVRIKFLVHGDDAGDPTDMYIDDLNLPGPCTTPTVTPTNTNTPTATRTNTPVPPTNTNTPTPTGTNTPAPTNTNTPTLTATCSPSGSYRVLLVYADGNPPTALQTQLLAEPGVVAVDLFNGGSGTPTLGQLQQYEIVAPFSNVAFADAATLGNNLADYVDGGGVVVQLGFSHYGPSHPLGINGRWVTGNYNPYNYSTATVSTAFTLGAYNAGHPLMAGVTALASDYQNVVTLAAGATQVAAASNGNSLIAYRPVGGRTTVGVTAYIGASSTQSGQWARVIANAGRWLAPPPCAGTATSTVAPTGTNTPVPPTATATRTNTPAPTNTPTTGPTPSATNTPLPATATDTPVPPTATGTLLPPTATDTPLPPTATDTPLPPTYTLYLPAAFYNATQPAGRPAAPGVRGAFYHAQ
jgi:subtilisin-like proprotein convertase family protein